MQVKCRLPARHEPRGAGIILAVPPALVPLVLVAIGVPAVVRAASGRPKGMAAAWILSVAAVMAAQAVGEIGGWRAGTLGEAQVLFACVGAALASITVAVLEGLRG
jgi:hypothetical protein